MSLPSSLLWGVAAFLLAPTLAFLIFEVWALLRFRLHSRTKTSALPPLPFQVARIFGEVLAMWRLFIWTPLHILQDGFIFGRSQAQGPPVILVHGHTQNGSNMWGFKRALERRGRCVFSVHLGLPFLPMRAYVPRLERAIQRALFRRPAHTFELICHSMGGVVARMTLAQSPQLAQRLGRVVTIATPHRGTGMARGLLAFGNGRDLSEESGFLQALPDFSQLAPQARVITVAAQDDWVVYPIENCHLPGARHMDLEAVGHSGTLTASRAISQVVDALLSESPPPQSEKGRA
jgi:triacylglycerol esterase/lipase EstA (alpha/beta hydrolase family)